MIMEENLPPGFRFHPTDEELITYYLSRKVSDFGFIARAIADVDLNKCEPWDLPAKASMGEKEWYFFSLKDRKYPTGLRTNRATDSGYWKTTGKDKEIFQSGVLVGMKKTLVFYKGRAPKGEKTNWVMHEYRHHTKFPHRPSKEEWVVCRVFRKINNIKKPQPSTPSISSMLDSPCNNNTPVLSELGEIDASILNNFMGSSGSLNNFQPTETGNKLDMNMYMNWVLNREQQSLNNIMPWTSNLLNTSFVTSQALLKGGLPFGVNYQPQSSSVANLNSFVGERDQILGNESKMSIPSSSSRATDPTFDQESAWRGY